MSNKNTKPNTVCDVCGKAIYRPPGKLKRSKGHKYCSQACFNKFGRAPYISGIKHGNWKGGVHYRRRRDGTKILFVPCPKTYSEMAQKNGYISEYRLIMARSLERPLTRTEVVHHINEDPTDNRLENLMLFANDQLHKLCHVELRKAASCDN